MHPNAALRKILKLPKKIERRLLTWLWATLVALIAVATGHCSDIVAPIVWPDEGEPTLLYSAQLRDDLRGLYLDGFNRAEKSIFLCIYSLSDRQLAAALRHQSEQGLSVTVVCDHNASPNAKQLLGSKVRLVLRGEKGLMHLKIAILDGQRLLIGSANLTQDGLTLQKNLVCGIHSKNLAEFIEKTLMAEFGLSQERIQRRHSTFSIGGQQLEMWLLPNQEASKRLIQLIDEAKSTLHVAMFTFTRHDLANALVRAVKRNVSLSLVLDRQQSASANQLAIKILEQKGIHPTVNRSAPLFHHKMMVIDGERLVCGSANWTKAAFNDNDDCFLILHSLTPIQKQRLKELWDKIEADATPLEEAA